MAQYDGMVLTNDGILLLTKSQIGQKMEFTRAEVGDGAMSPGATFQDMTALISPKLSLTIQDATVSEEDSEQMDVTTIVTNTGVEEGFFIREIGLFAKGADGIEKLYAYTNAGDYPDYLPSYKLNEITDQLTISVIISNEKNVTVNINDNFTIATKKNLKDHDENTNAHGNLMDKHNASLDAHTPRFDAHDKDKTAHNVRFNEYLPRAGGQMKNGATIGMESDMSALKVSAATEVAAGATVTLYGKGYAESDKQGTANITATNGIISSTVKLSPDGSLKVDGNDVITAKGGVMTTKYGLVRDVNNGELNFCGGKSDTSGASLRLLGKDSGSGAAFSLSAYDTRNNDFRSLIGEGDGSLEWDYNEVITGKGGQSINGTLAVEHLLSFRDDSQLYVSGGNGLFNGAHGIFYGKDHSTASGEFDIVAGTTEQDGVHFIGRPDGGLSWNGRNIVRSINGEYANAAGDISIKTGDGNPIGTIITYAGSDIREGYLLCDGSAISRMDYAGLFAVIGTTYGEGDGDSTFNLPLLTDNRFVEFAATAGAAKDAGLPNITGQCATSYNASIISQNFKGAFYNIASYWDPKGDDGHTFYQYYLGLDASRSNPIYNSNVTTVQPTSLSFLPLIKYI